MIKDLGFSTLKFYDNYVICEVNEGVLFSIKENRIQIQEVQNYFRTKPFVYITHRKNSYTVDPTIHNESTLIESLLGIAVVSKNETVSNNLQIEKLFFKKPLKHFTSIEMAKEWSQKLIKGQSIIPKNG